MSKSPRPNVRDNIRATAPKLIKLTEEVIYDDTVSYTHLTLPTKA